MCRWIVDIPSVVATQKKKKNKLQAECLPCELAKKTHLRLDSNTWKMLVLPAFLSFNIYIYILLLYIFFFLLMLNKCKWANWIILYGHGWIRNNRCEGCFHGNFASLLKPEALRRWGDVVEDTVLSSSSQGRPIRMHFGVYPHRAKCLNKQVIYQKLQSFDF